MKHRRAGEWRQNPARTRGEHELRGQTDAAHNACRVGVADLVEGLGAKAEQVSHPPGDRVLHKAAGHHHAVVVAHQLAQRPPVHGQTHGHQ
jgi:hypothetical protein